MSDIDHTLTAPLPGAPNEAPKEALCWALMGASGGVGVTSLAVQMAYSAMKLASKSADRPARVCLIDLDFECGALASYLDIAAGIATDQLQGDCSRIDAALTSAFIVKHPSGIRLLSAPNMLGGNDVVNPDCVLALMDAASTMYDVVILDVPRLWRPWTHAALAAADKFHLVTELTIPGLHQTRRRIEDIEMSADLSSPVGVMINKFERRSLRTNLTAKDAQKAIGRDISHFICVDEQTTTNALNCGEPAGSLKPDSRFVKDVDAMTQAMLPAHNSQQITASKPAKRRGLFSRGAA